jgi:dipeptidyl aminopeptidase/acylaminoacyl peptidase
MYAGYHPFGSYGSFDWILEGARKNGSYVAKLDYPGSFGYGINYTNKIIGNIGKEDINSMLNNIKIIKNKYKSIKKVSLAGISYGGYMVLKSYAENPSDFENVFSFAPVSDWESQDEKDPYLLFNIHFNKKQVSTSTINSTSSRSSTSTSVSASNTESVSDPKLRELYDEASIYDKISILPKENNLFLYHGNADKNVQYKQSVAFDKLMSDNKKNYNFTTFEGQPHVFNKRSIWTKACSDILSKIGDQNTNYCKLN